MSTWNFRLVKSSTPDDETVCLCEVYYDDHGKPVAYADPCTVADTVEEMSAMIVRYGIAVTLPVLNPVTDFVGKFSEFLDDDEGPAYEPNR